MNAPSSTPGISGCQIDWPNILGLSGLASLENAAAFSRIQNTIKSNTTARFMKGIKDENSPSDEANQNDETANMLWRNDYREPMGVSHPKLHRP